MEILKHLLVVVYSSSLGIEGFSRTQEEIKIWATIKSGEGGRMEKNRKC